MGKDLYIVRVLFFSFWLFNFKMCLCSFIDFFCSCVQLIISSLGHSTKRNFPFVGAVPN